MLFVWHMGEETLTTNILAVLVALLGSALVIAARAAFLFGRTGWAPRLRAAVVLWGVAALALWLTFGFGGHASANFGPMTFHLASLGWGILFGIAGLVTFPFQIALAKAMRRLPAPPEALEALAEVPLLGRIFLLLTAGLVEELLFRAVPITLLHALTGSLAFAIGVPLVAFVLMHRSSWGALHLIFVALAGAILTVAFLIGGLWAAVIAHLLMDMPLMLTAPSLARRAKAGAAKASRLVSEAS